jgi:hypothetical protein
MAVPADSRSGDPTGSITWGKVSRPVAWGASLLAGLAYALLEYGHIHGQVSVLDEGLYLYKGLLFARGIYRPFQDFGPLTNHMPLSFLIPGWVQLVFGPGLATGRVYALVVGLLMVLGLWTAARRLAGDGWAAAAIWLVVINTGWLKIYSQAISQGLIACMLMWVVAIGVGEDRKAWQTALAAALAGVMGLTRLNMMPVVVLFVPYVYWAHGRRSGHAAAMAGGGVLLAGHIVFWPGMLKLWAVWLPAAVTPFLDGFRDQAGGIQAWTVVLTTGSKLGILRDGLRLHLAAVTGAVWAWLLVPLGPVTPSARHRRATMAFLTALFVLLFGLHAAATLGKTYCPFCLKNYIAFFSPIGLIVLAIAGAHWLKRAPLARRAAALFILLVVPWALGFSMGAPLAEAALQFELPRLSGGAILPGTARLGSMLTVKFGLAQDALIASVTNLQLVGMAAFFLAGVAILARAGQRDGAANLARPALMLLSLATAVTIGLSSFKFGSAYSTYDCGQDVIASQTAVGADLRAKVLPGSSVYWASGGQSPVPLIYLDQPMIFPPQLNGVYSYRYGGDPIALSRFGHWNAELAQTWLQEADYVLLQEKDYTGWLAMHLNSGDFDQRTPTPPTNPCETASSILIFHRIASTSPTP